MINIAQALRGSGLDALDARVLLRAVLARDDVYLIAHADDALDTSHEARFRELVARRAAGEPVAYIVGEREFYGHVFKVNPGRSALTPPACSVLKSGHGTPLWTGYFASMFVKEVTRSGSMDAGRSSSKSRIV